MNESLKKIRMKAGYETKDAAKALNISMSLLYKLEQGYRKPSRELILRMSKVYNCSVDAIFMAIDITNSEKLLVV